MNVLSINEKIIEHRMGRKDHLNRQPDKNTAKTFADKRDQDRPNEPARHRNRHNQCSILEQIMILITTIKTVLSDFKLNNILSKLCFS